MKKLLLIIPFFAATSYSMQTNQFKMIESEKAQKSVIAGYVAANATSGVSTALGAIQLVDV